MKIVSLIKCFKHSYPQEVDFNTFRLIIKFCFFLQGIPEFDNQCFKKYGKMWG